MAIVSIKVLKNQRKKNGTYNVKIQITHKKDVRYIKTHHFVCDEQLHADLTIKDPFIYNQLHNQALKYRAAIGKLDNILDYYSASDIRDYLLNIYLIPDLIKFSKDHVADLEKAGRKSTASTFKTVIYSLNDYFKKELVSALEITNAELNRYEKYLRSERTITRLCNKTIITRTVKGMTNTGIHNHMRDLRILYKAAMRFYNNPQFNEMKIPYCPFDDYKIVEVAPTRKRSLKVSQIRTIRDTYSIPNSRAELGRDMFMLSFYLCGMNAVDIYKLQPENIINGRVEYYRSKTKRRQKDNAFISIKITKAAKPLLEKYLGKLKVRYSGYSNLDHAINNGLKKLLHNSELSMVTYYWARHSFGNIARNKCRMSKDDVALALNHSDQYHKTTDIYLEKNWKIADEVQKAVVKKLNKI